MLSYLLTKKINLEKLSRCFYTAEKENSTRAVRQILLSGKDIRKIFNLFPGRRAMKPVTRALPFGSRQRAAGTGTCAG